MLVSQQVSTQRAARWFHLTGNLIFFYATTTMSYRPSGFFHTRAHLVLGIFFSGYNLQQTVYLKKYSVKFIDFEVGTAVDKEQKATLQHLSKPIPRICV